MAKLTYGERNSLPSGDFGLPGRRAFPMPDKSHAANAEARATQGVMKGSITPAQAAQIRAKAKSVLGK
jgi:hypothetical protein